MFKLSTPIPFEAAIFSLTEEQLAKLNVWHEEVNRRAAENQANTPIGEKFIAMGLRLPYYGAIGGALTFSFSGTSLGTACKVQEVITGEEIDLTDYDSW